MSHRFNNTESRLFTLVLAGLVAVMAVVYSPATYADSHTEEVQQAEETDQPAKTGPLSAIGVGVRAGLLGLGVEAATPLVKNLNGRVGFNTFGYTFESTTEDIEYDFDLQLRSLMAVVDWLPFGSAFRLCGGLALNGNEIKLTTSEASASYTIGGTTYSSSELGTFTGKIGFGSPSPYVGIGFGNPVGKSRFGVVFDIGVVLQGSPQVDLSATGAIAQDPTFQANLQKEEQDIEDEINFFTAYPVITFGINYTF